MVGPMKYAEQPDRIRQVSRTNGAFRPSARAKLLFRHANNNADKQTRSRYVERTASFYCYDATTVELLLVVCGELPAEVPRRMSAESRGSSGALTDAVPAREVRH